MKKFFIPMLLCIAVCMLLGACSAASAETSYDLRASIQAYGRKVARLNAGMEEAASSRSQPQQEMVLFMTDGADLNFDRAPFSARCVVYGPDGFSALLCDSPQKAIDWLLEQEGVLCAETDAAISACTETDGAKTEEPSPEDPETVSFQSWGAEALGFAKYLDFTKRVGTGSATVAVVDSGVYSHSLIDPKIRSTGYDYVDNDTDPTNDLNGHGTRVAGIVADCSRNMPVYIYPIRVLNAEANGKLSNLINAVLEAVDAQVDVINLSLTTAAQSDLLEAAIRSAVDAGITVVAAAGNQNCDASLITPAKMTDRGVIVVGSVEQNGSRSGFSNYGDSVDVYAYGRNILCCSRNGGYVSDTGTSMAAPHVSALSALLTLTHPSISPEGVEARIRAASAGSIPVLSVSAMTPQDLGFSLGSISLAQDARLILPTRALPAPAMEPIEYVSSAPEVVGIADGVLSAKSIGSATVTASCRGFEDAVFTVEVSQAEGSVAALPLNLQTIGEEAFWGLTAARVDIPSGALRIEDRAFDEGRIDFISIPDTVADIGENSFSGAVILCAEDSAAHRYAVEHDLQYLVQENE